MDKNINFMMSFYKEMYRMRYNSKSIYRELKLKSMGEIICPNLRSIRVKNFFFNQDYWKYIQDYKAKSIITGSVALKAFGFIDRPVFDLDLILLESNSEITTNLIGTSQYKKTRVRFFQHCGQDFIESDGIKFHNPYQILKHKLDLFLDDGDSKHFSDLKYFFEKIDSSVE